MLRDGAKTWSDGQSDAYNSDPEDEEEMIFSENEEDVEEMMDLSDLPASLFACSVHECVFEDTHHQSCMSSWPPEAYLLKTLLDYWKEGLCEVSALQGPLELFQI
ncbi:RCAN3 protein, partial [Polypterus senegalus]|nr:RCAN3 protein [Polypterus senegalus]